MRFVTFGTLPWRLLEPVGEALYLISHTRPEKVGTNIPFHLT